MKITRLVILFNYQKLALGFFVSLLLLVVSLQINSGNVSLTLKVVAALIFFNIIAAIVASNILYDRSDLYELKEAKKIIDFKAVKAGLLIHASFDHSR